MLRNQALDLLRHERIQTTVSKAKELRPFVERLISIAKRSGEDAGNGRVLTARRVVLRDIHDPDVVKKLFDDLGARYATRPGGYTRILRLGPRRGDGAEMAIVELLGSEYKPEKKDEKGKKTEAEKKTEAKPAKAAAPRAKKKGEGKPAGEKKASAKGKAKKKGAAKEAE